VDCTDIFDFGKRRLVHNYNNIHFVAIEVGVEESTRNNIHFNRIHRGVARYFHFLTANGLGNQNRLPREQNVITVNQMAVNDITHFQLMVSGSNGIFSCHISLFKQITGTWILLRAIVECLFEPFHVKWMRMFPHKQIHGKLQWNCYGIGRIG